MCTDCESESTVYVFFTMWLRRYRLSQMGPTEVSNKIECLVPEGERETLKCSL